MDIIYRELNRDEICPELFDGFDRFQDVKKCWRKENGQWILKDIAFTEQWSEEDYKYLVRCLINTVDTGGVVLGAFINNVLKGFASVEGKFIGSKLNYLQLSSIHISNGYRGYGIGRTLFCTACEKAAQSGARKLYISAHSSEETQLFYKAMGCKEAEEYDPYLTAAEPCDCQLEISLT